MIGSQVDAEQQQTSQHTLAKWLLYICRGCSRGCQTFALDEFRLGNSSTSMVNRRQHFGVFQVNIAINSNRLNFKMKYFDAPMKGVTERKIETTIIRAKTHPFRLSACHCVDCSQLFFSAITHNFFCYACHRRGETQSFR